MPCDKQISITASSNSLIKDLVSDLLSPASLIMVSSTEDDQTSLAAIYLRHALIVTMNTNVIQSTTITGISMYSSIYNASNAS